MKISLITTVLNEETNIISFIASVTRQTRLPDEFIIVDGGSRDRTISNIKYQISNIKLKQIRFKIIQKKGNRAVGRNEAVRQAQGNIILCTDAGCILKEDWTEKMMEAILDPQLKRSDGRNKEIDVVAGYYEGCADNIFQKCLIPYALVMPDKVNPVNFLPASRSMAFTKKIWEKTGGFNEQLSHNEDYAFAHTLKKLKAKIHFQKEAIVYWLPRKNYHEAFIMFFRFALGDAEAGIIRPKVILLFARYLSGIPALAYTVVYSQYFMLNILYLILFSYLGWAVWKNYKYVRDWRAFLHLPLLQLTSDTAVICGTICGLTGRRKGGR